MILNTGFSDFKHIYSGPQNIYLGKSCGNPRTFLLFETIRHFKHADLPFSEEMANLGGRFEGRQTQRETCGFEGRFLF